MGPRDFVVLSPPTERTGRQHRHRQNQQGCNEEESGRARHCECGKIRSGERLKERKKNGERCVLFFYRQLWLSHPFIFGGRRQADRGSYFCESD